MTLDAPKEAPLTRPSEHGAVSDRDDSNPSTGEFVAQFARGGYLWTMVVNQRIGALLAMWSMRLRLRPAHLTFLNLVLGTATSAAVAVLYGGAPWPAAIVGIVGWELAYSLDCADGQLARATGKTSHRGAVSDLMGDFLVQLTVLATTLQIATARMTPTWSAVFSVFVTGGWMISLYFGGVLGWEALPLPVRGMFRWLDAFRHVRDYGLQVAAVSLALPPGPLAVGVVLAVIAAVNYAALALNVARNRGAPPTQ